MTLNDGLRTAAPRSHRQFLQTALFVDDLALEPQLEVPKTVVAPIVLGASTPPAEPSSKPAPVAESAESSRFGQDVSRTTELVNAMADHGITCSILTPSGGLDEDSAARVHRLARRTDILILDWNLGAGATSAPLIRQVLADDELAGGRLRLIVVYTAEVSIENLIRDLMEEIGEGSVVRNEDAVSGAHFRVCFVKKRPIGLDYVGVEGGLSPSELAERALDEFDNLAGSGLLQRLALRTVSEVRDQAHHLLTRFDSSLDPAFIGHRAQTSHREAVLFSLDLLGTELAALVRASDISEMLSSEMVSDRIDSLLGDRKSARHWNAKAASAGKEVAAEAIRKFLGTPNADTRSAAGVKPGDPSVSSLLVDDGSDFANLQASVTRVEQSFALLASLVRSSQYDQPRLANPVLEFGVVVRQPSGDYLMCLQPLCDSVRVDATDGKDFIFLPLVSSDSDLRFSIMVWDEEPRPLNAGPLSGMTTHRFLGNPVSGVVNASSHGASRKFLTPDGAALEWVGTVRESHARRIMHSLVTQLTRVGLDEPYLMVRN